MWINQYTKDLIIQAEDECIIAEWVGWKNISTHDGVSYTGYPTEEEMSFMGSSRLRRAKKGESHVPWYHCDADEMLRVERLIEKRGLKAKYIKTISKYLKLDKLSEPERSWKLLNIHPSVKCYALLLITGHKPYSGD